MLKLLNTPKFISQLNFILSRKERKTFVGLIFFSILISLIEMMGVSVIMPFVAVATNLSLIDDNYYYSTAFIALGIESKHNFVIIFGIIVIMFYLFRVLANISYVYLLNKFTEGMYYKVSHKLFKTYMGLPYIDFIKKNSSTLTKTIMQEASHLTDLLRNVLMGISEIFVIFFIYLMLLYVDVTITIVLTLILIVLGAVLIKKIGRRMKVLGASRSAIHTEFYELVSKSFGNYKVIKLRSDEKKTLNDFNNPIRKLVSANITASTIANLPKILLEGIGFSLIIAIIVYLFWQHNGDISSVLAILSVFILSLFRLLPSVNRIISSYNAIMLSHKSLEIIYGDLNLNSEKNGEKYIPYRKNIKLEGVSFSYNYEDSLTLKNINIEILKNDKVAFIGESGSGKSTLIDLLIGLNFPTQGSVMIDGVKLCEKNVLSWRNRVAYIPQSIYLFDGTVEDNVVFGRNYNQKKIIEVLKKSHMYDYLQTKEGLKTEVGESGALLSGGQKQRLAIARALYGDPEVLVLDEATSALDTKIEKSIMNNVYESSNNITLIIITHRLSTVDRCNKIYKIHNGKVN